MDFLHVKIAIDRLVEAKVLRVTINGGEPLTHPDFLKIVEYIHRKPIGWKMISNATLVTDEVAERISKARPLKIHVSLDGATEQAYGFLRGKNNFTKTMKGIENLLNYNVPVAISCTLHKRNANKNDLMKLRELAERYGIEEVAVSPLDAVGRAFTNWNEIAPTQAQIREILPFLSEFGGEDVVFPIVTADDMLPEGKHLSCILGGTFISIDTQGFIVPCQRFFNTEFANNNIFNENIIEAWNSPSFVFLRALPRSRNFCIYRDYCRWYKEGLCRHCMAASYRYFKQFFMPNPECIFDAEKIGLKNIKYVKYLREKLRETKDEKQQK